MKQIQGRNVTLQTTDLLLLSMMLTYIKKQKLPTDSQYSLRTNKSINFLIETTTTIKVQEDAEDI